MLGFVYTLFVSIGAVIHKTKQNKENEENKVKFQNPDGLTYVDIEGKSRFLSNNEVGFYTYDRNGDYVLEDASGYIYKNFSKEKKEKEQTKRYTEAIKNNETTYCIDDNDHKNDWYCKGKRFKDVQTGDIYVIRRLNYTYWYLNITNGMIIRKTDWQLKQDKIMKSSHNFKDKTLYDEIYYIDVNDFNKRRYGTQNKSEFYLDHKYNFDCDLHK